MLFASWLAQVEHLSPATISVYLSAVRSSHIDLGFPDPMANCLRLPRVLRGIKRTMASRQSPRLPNTKALLNSLVSRHAERGPRHVLGRLLYCLFRVSTGQRVHH